MILIFYFSMLGSFLSPSAHADGRFALVVEPTLVTSSNGNRKTTVVVVNVYNLNGIESFDDITVQLLPDSGCIKHIKKLEPLHSESFECLLMSDRQQLSVQYVLRGNAGSLLRALPAHADASTSTLSGALMPALLALLGVILGAILSHLLTVAREREKARLERTRAEFERYEKPFIAFLSCWSESTSVDLLRNCYKQLQTACLVPSSISQIYHQTIKILVDQNAVTEAKEQASQTLKAALERFLEQRRI